MIDRRRRCGNIGRVGSTSTFTVSSTCSFYKNRLGLREVEHAAAGGVDERHVAGDCGGPSRTDSSGGLASPGPDRGACREVLDILAESETRSGVRGGPGLTREGAGVHPGREMYLRANPQIQGVGRWPKKHPRLRNRSSRSAARRRRPRRGLETSMGTSKRLGGTTAVASTKKRIFNGWSNGGAAKRSSASTGRPGSTALAN